MLHTKFRGNRPAGSGEDFPIEKPVTKFDLAVK